MAQWLLYAPLPYIKTVCIHLLLMIQKMDDCVLKQYNPFVHEDEVYFL